MVAICVVCNQVAEFLPEGVWVHRDPLLYGTPHRVEISKGDARLLELRGDQ